MSFVIDRTQLMGQACSSYDTAGPHGEPVPSPLPSPPSSFVDGMAPDFDPMFDEVCAISIHDCLARAARAHPYAPISTPTRLSHTLLAHPCVSRPQLPPSMCAVSMRAPRSPPRRTVSSDVPFAFPSQKSSSVVMYDGLKRRTTSS